MLGELVLLSCKEKSGGLMNVIFVKGTRRSNKIGEQLQLQLISEVYLELKQFSLCFLLVRQMISSPDFLR